MCYTQTQTNMHRLGADLFLCELWGSTWNCQWQQTQRTHWRTPYACWERKIEGGRGWGGGNSSERSTKTGDRGEIIKKGRYGRRGGWRQRGGSVVSFGTSCQTSLGMWGETQTALPPHTHIRVPTATDVDWSLCTKKTEQFSHKALLQPNITLSRVKCFTSTESRAESVLNSSMSTRAKDWHDTNTPIAHQSHMCWRVVVKLRLKRTETYLLYSGQRKGAEISRASGAFWATEDKRKILGYLNLN